MKQTNATQYNCTQITNQSNTLKTNKPSDIKKLKLSTVVQENSSIQGNVEINVPSVMNVADESHAKKSVNLTKTKGLSLADLAKTKKSKDQEKSSVPEISQTKENSASVPTKKLSLLELASLKKSKYIGVELDNNSPSYKQQHIIESNTQKNKEVVSDSKSPVTQKRSLLDLTQQKKPGVIGGKFSLADLASRKPASSSTCTQSGSVVSKMSDLKLEETHAEQNVKKPKICTKEPQLTLADLAGSNKGSNSKTLKSCPASDNSVTQLEDQLNESLSLNDSQSQSDINLSIEIFSDTVDRNNCLVNDVKPSTLGTILCELHFNSQVPVDKPKRKLRYPKFSFTSQKKVMITKAPVPLRDIAAFSFNTPSPDDIVKQKQSQMKHRRPDTKLDIP